MKNVLQCAKNGEMALGMYVSLADPTLVELAAYAGFDYIRVDCEHSMLDMQTVANLVRAADSVGLAVQVRVSSLDDIPHLLDFGVQGIVVPGVKNKEDALKAVELVKYAPQGERGMASVIRTLQYGARSLKEYAKTANDTVNLTIQIESKEGLENLDEILSVDGIDMVSSGKLDLSQALGVFGEAKNPIVLEAENKIIDAALRHNKLPTMMVNDPKRAEELVKKGISCLTIGYDVKIIMASFKEQITQYR